ncbi:MAG TPA: hypothetical protein PKZ32_16860 [Candidatus Melainabacteria bacterium]|nr:hypothetical protein [Candidatus Melainabacteria bacterium]
MADPQEDDAKETMSSEAGAEALPGTEEQSSAFLNNLRSSYTPDSRSLGYYGGGAMPRNLRTSFQMPSQSRFGLSAPFAFDERTATTIDGEKIESDEDEEGGQRRTERLKTGDTLRQLPDQEILEMKNKDRLIIYKTLGWIMEDGKGNPIIRQVGPDGDTSTFGLEKGGDVIAQAIEISGITTIFFNNGDKIIFDLAGVSSISRKKESVYLREPIRKALSFQSPFRYRAY